MPLFGNLWLRQVQSLPCCTPCCLGKFEGHRMTSLVCDTGLPSGLPFLLAVHRALFTSFLPFPLAHPLSCALALIFSGLKRSPIAELCTGSSPAAGSRGRLLLGPCRGTEPTKAVGPLGGRVIQRLLSAWADD